MGVDTMKVKPSLDVWSLSLASLLVLLVHIDWPRFLSCSQTAIRGPEFKLFRLYWSLLAGPEYDLKLFIQVSFRPLVVWMLPSDEGALYHIEFLLVCGARSSLLWGWLTRSIVVLQFAFLRLSGFDDAPYSLSFRNPSSWRGITMWPWRLGQTMASVHTFRIEIVSNLRAGQGGRASSIGIGGSPHLSGEGERAAGLHSQLTVIPPGSPYDPAQSHSSVCGHRTLKAPHPVWSAQLTRVPPC